jgi:hypothetical protein
MLTLKLEFEDPLFVSLETQDKLIVSVRDRDMFTAKTGVVIAAKYTMEAKLPKQMKNSGNHVVIMRYRFRLGPGQARQGRLRVDQLSN